MQMRISQPERIQEVSEQTRILAILFRSPASNDPDLKEEMLELDASSEEAISGITGYSVSSAITGSLGASTTAGRSWGPHGDHRPVDGKSLRNSPDANLRLRFLSGDQTEDNYILRWLPSYNQI